MAGVDPVSMAVMVASTAASESARRNQVKAQKRSYQSQMDLLNARYAIDERNRKQDLKQVSARQRARFAAQGLSSSDGSSSAVLDGLKSLSETQARDRDSLAELQRRRGAEALAGRAGGNLLERQSPQLLDNMVRLLNWD